MFSMLISWAATWAASLVSLGDATYRYCVGLPCLKGALPDARDKSTTTFIILLVTSSMQVWHLIPWLMVGVPQPLQA